MSDYRSHILKDLNGVDDLFSSAPFIGIRRHRLLTDGDGVTTLVAFHGCPLSCKYCINPQCKSNDGIWMYLTPAQLYERVKIDDIYFKSTGGGIVFGGGEPLLYPKFIKQFYDLCSEKNWKISVETSLNVDTSIVQQLLPIVSEYIVDIKDINSNIYISYTGKDNRKVIENLCYLVENGASDKIVIRIPFIEGYNTKTDIQNTKKVLQRMGLRHFDPIDYIFKLKKTKRDDKHSPIGKAICEVLKQMRQLIAETNKIEYIPHECHHQGNCLGTCPLCDNELKLLTEELYAKKAQGFSINL